jgi:acylphosphatase
MGNLNALCYFSLFLYLYLNLYLFLLPLPVFPCSCYNVPMVSGVHLLISGRVQGVCYRAFTQDQAIKLGLNGWVRNMHDGRVEAVLEGQKEFVEQAILACKNGPPGARVTDIDITWKSPGEEQGFEIRY